jgi:hypothetical protein
MTIYDPIAEALGVLPNTNLDYLFSPPPEYNPEIQRLEALKRNAEFVTCDRCGQTGNRPNMMRWHFDNCKTTLNKKCLYCEKIISPVGIKRRVYEKQKYCNNLCYISSRVGIAPIEMTPEIKAKLSRSAYTRKAQLAERIRKTQPWKYCRNGKNNNNK